MEMLLMGVCLSLFGLAVAAAAFNAAQPREEVKPPARPALADAVPDPPTRFFGNPKIVPTLMRTQVPIEALLLEIENHVRLEHAAAESFLAAPHPDLLHSRTM
ncbi:MAG: hypothetical protein ABFD86_23585, partial [Bryobacteraceae bacterium]